MAEEKTKKKIHPRSQIRGSRWQGFDRQSIGMQNLGFHWCHTSDGQIQMEIYIIPETN